MKDKEEEKPLFNETERPALTRLFHAALIYLGVLIAASLSTSIYFVANPPHLRAFLALATGLLGSAIAALISCVQRHADGYEDSCGVQIHSAKRPRIASTEACIIGFSFDLGLVPSLELSLTGV